MTSDTRPRIRRETPGVFRRRLRRRARIRRKTGRAEGRSSAGRRLVVGRKTGRARKDGTRVGGRGYRAGVGTPNPWFSWAYVQANRADILAALTQHVLLTLEAVAIAVAIALPLTLIAYRHPRLSGLVVGTSGVLYTIPSLALFAVLYPLLRDRRTTVLVGLVVYALLVLVRNVLVGLRGVDPAVTDAARGCGQSPARILFTVQLPNALPSIVVGLRLATVSTVALVTIGVVVGYGGLGELMYLGFTSLYRAEIVTATLLTLAIALVADVVLWFAGRLATPWTASRHD